MADLVPLRWGLLGTARINRAVIPPIRGSKNSRLLAIASRTTEKAAQSATSWGIPRYYSDYEALLADPEIDVIYNSLPNNLHTEWSLRAMRAGKHVLCEKPLTISSQDVDTLIAVSQETGRVITEAFMYRHHPQTLLVKRMVDDGEIGRLQLVRGTFSYVNTRQGDTRFDPTMGGGSLWDIGGYSIGYACYLAGSMPQKVFGNQVTGPTGVELRYAGQLIFPNDVISQFESSFITEYKVGMEISGDKGRIIVPEPFKPGKSSKIYLWQTGHERVIRVKGCELYQGEIEDIENAILHGIPPRINLKESQGIIKAIEACYQSAQLGKPIQFEPETL